MLGRAFRQVPSGPAEAGEGLLEAADAGGELDALESIEVALRAALVVGDTVRSGRIVAAMTGGVLLVVDAVAGESARATVPPRTERSAASPQPPQGQAPIGEYRHGDAVIDLDDG